MNTEERKVIQNNLEKQNKNEELKRYYMVDDEKEQPEQEEQSEEIIDDIDKEGRELQDGESDTSEEFEEFLKGYNN
jgi:hypothetical protein